MRAGIVSLLLLGACDGGDDTTTAGGPTYYADVRPILDQHCARCHTDSGIAPSFDRPEDVVGRASLISQYVSEGIMPPPAPDPSCAPYQGSDVYFLPDDQKQVLVDWAATGAELGDPADAPEPPQPVTIGPFDVELVPTVPYTPTFSNGDPNDYRCWAFDLGNDQPIYLHGMQALIDQTHEVHHAVIFLDTRLNTDPSDTDGFSCSGLGEAGWDYLHGWGPGSPPMLLGDGQGIQLPAHARIVYQSHYYDNGEATPDASGYGLLLQDQVDQEVTVYPFGVEDFTIPPGEADHEETMDLSWRISYGHFTVLGVWPHMHTHGSGFDLHVDHADGTSTCVVDMPAYDFSNQVAVMLDTPVEVSPGDHVVQTCHYDNSQGREPVSFGEGTNNEMCYGFTYGIFH